jgi:aspartate/methionine/tyrosine aminotransferase
MKAVVRALSAMVSETFSAVSAPTQYAAVRAYGLDLSLLQYVNDCTAIHKACAEYLHQRFTAMGLHCLKPEGAFYLFPSFKAFAGKLSKKGIRTCIELSQNLVQNNGVAVLPGDDFYYSPNELCTRVATVDYDGAKVFQAAKTAASLDKAFVEKNCPHLMIGSDRIEEFLNSL